MKRGEIWWATMSRPSGSEPGFRRPVLIVQSDAFNQSTLNTVVAVALTSNLHLAEAPGNVLLTPRQTGLPKPSVTNVAQIVTLDRTRLTERVGHLPNTTLAAVEKGVRLVLGLSSTDPGTAARGSKSDR